MGKLKDLLIQYTDHVYDLITPYIDTDDPTIYDKCQDLVIQFASIRRNKALIADKTIASIYFDVVFHSVKWDFIDAVDLPCDAEIDFNQIFSMIDPGPFIDNYIR